MRRERAGVCEYLEMNPLSARGLSQRLEPEAHPPLEDIRLWRRSTMGGNPITEKVLELIGVFSALVF
jgi:hypothetical protein